MIYLIGIMLIAIVVRKVKKVKVKKEVKKEPSFYERMQMWKYANKVIEHCLKIESE